MSGDEERYVAEAFRTNWIAPLGPLVDTFEEKLAAYAGTSGAAAVSSGTAAIHLALKLLGVGKGYGRGRSGLFAVRSGRPDSETGSGQITAGKWTASGIDRDA